ncbi:hypothetical protein [Salinicola tamaricis]|uniref:hypothetical protein n=1 Tax=Salinicola tamaricis TaxID=1771309 RepID=UPI000D0A5F33|nr:hypothetical protein [Salinicola tamaricis]
MSLLDQARRRHHAHRLSDTVARGCGTLFYPERKGQLPGRIDPGVAIADGIGLLFFIVPGVIAYAIDFSNNTIYLPGEAGAGIDATHLDDPADTAQVDALLASRGLPQGWQAEVVRVERPRDLARRWPGSRPHGSISPRAERRYRQPSRLARRGSAKLSGRGAAAP